MSVYPPTSNPTGLRPMTPHPWFTVQLEPRHLHPEATLDAPATRFWVPCSWVRVAPDKPAEWKACLATDLDHTVIPRRVYERVNMRIDDLSAEPFATWQGYACFVGTARFGLPADERPRPVGDTTDIKRQLLPLSMRVLLPERDPPSSRGQILFGMSFFVQYTARLRLDCLSPGDGQILLPGNRRG